MKVIAAGETFNGGNKESSDDNEYAFIPGK